MVDQTPDTGIHLDFLVSPENVGVEEGGARRTWIMGATGIRVREMGDGVMMMRHRCWRHTRLYFFPEDAGGGKAICGTLVGQPHPCMEGDCACLDDQGIPDPGWMGPHKRR